MEVPYIGHLLTLEGLHVDPKEVKAIEEMPEPEDAKAVQRLLGSVNYLAKFVPHLSDILEPLRRLMDKDTEWWWLHKQQEALDHMMKALTSTPVLQYYDVKKPVCIQCDASDGGMSMHFMHLLPLRETIRKSRSYSLSYMPARSVINMCMAERRYICRFIIRL